MICDFPQIQGGQQISIFSINLLASLNLLEKTGFIKSDGVRDINSAASAPLRSSQGVSAIRGESEKYRPADAISRGSQGAPIAVLDG
jgi:hypothetical protein